MTFVDHSEGSTMQQHKIFGYCHACDAPLIEGMKLNLAPCPEHPGEMLAYCDPCVRDAESRLKARKHT